MTGFKFSIARFKKSPTGYVGVKNLGCICYMIAMLQQFYMIPRFRYGILCVQHPSDTDANLDILRELQVRFAALTSAASCTLAVSLLCVNVPCVLCARVRVCVPDHVRRTEYERTPVVRPAQLLQLVQGRPGAARECRCAAGCRGVRQHVPR